MKIEICFLYNGVSYSWEPAVSEVIFKSRPSLDNLGVLSTVLLLVGFLEPCD